MPQLRDLVFLLPDYELEGYPRHLPSDQAARLLNGWVSLWHPGLIAAAQTIPRWNQAGQLPSDLSASIFVLPEISSDHLTPDARAQIEAAGSVLLEPGDCWRKMQSEMLSRHGEIPRSELADELTQQYAALGYAYLQIQLMTRQLRYTSNLDQLQFGEQACKSVEAALSGDRERAEQMLQACFDSLGQERDHYYSLDVNLIDVTLLAESTLGNSLSRQLETPTTLLTTANLLATLRQKNGETFERLQSLLAEEQLAIVGGLPLERPHPLMPRESAVRDLARGKQAYEALGFKPPRVFARMSFGMHSESASLLKRHGFDGVLLTAWSAGNYPTGSQVKMSWESSDGTYLPALAAPVIDAMDPASFLSLGWTVGEALDHQHVPTLTFAHWPDATGEYYALLRIVSQHTPALGKWILADEYFAVTDQPYHQERLSSDGFRHNWLTESQSPAKLIEQTKLTHQLQARLRSLQNLLNLSWQLSQYRNVASAVTTNEEGETFARVFALDGALWAPELRELSEQVDSLFDAGANPQEVVDSANLTMKTIRRQVLEDLQAKLRGSGAAPDPVAVGGRLIVNPASCPTRVNVHTSAEQGVDPDAAWNFAKGKAGNDRVSCVDVPSLGFVFAPLISGAAVDAAKAKSKFPTIAAAGGLLQNEFFEAQVDVGRGHLKSLHVPSRRGNRLSMMLAYRQRTDKGGFQYSDMVASDVRMITSSNMCGIVRSTGRLEDAGQVIGKFEIDYEVWRGSRIIEVAVKLSDLRPLNDANPWRAAYTLRLAWPTEAAILRTYSAGSQVAWGGGRTVSPELIEIDETDYRTHYLTGGMAFHRRTEPRFLETVLAVGSQRTFTHRFGIGVDLPSPALAARQFLDWRYELDLEKPIGADSGWLVSVDVRSVTVDLETPLVDAAGKLVGMRLFVCEHSGKSTSARIRLLREVSAAHRVDYLGERLSKLTASEDCVTIALRAHERIGVDVLWKT
ncbi:MAG: hypothetical protein R3C53_15300 [Pirellulaceae bacterium]